MTEPLEAGRLCPGFLSTDKYVVEMHIGMDDWSTPEDLVASIRWHLNLPRVEGVTIYRPHGSELHYRLVDDEPKCVYNSWRDRPGYWMTDPLEAAKTRTLIVPRPDLEGVPRSGSACTRQRCGRQSDWHLLAWADDRPAIDMHRCERHVVAMFQTLQEAGYTQILVEML